jgi:2-polyprenyl-3-methyl-5-hydroxy-6-metoxy-1,4-benzoquinol methylase
MKSLEFTPVESCILCGCKDLHPAVGSSFRGVAFSYSYCTRCGLKRIDPQPTPESLEQFFREDYWQDNLKGTGIPRGDGYGDSALNQMDLRMPKYKKVYDRVREHLKGVREIGPRTTFLEIGCGFGYTLQWLARDYGCQVFGVEPSDEAIKYCEETGSIKVLARTAEEFFVEERQTAEDGEPEKFDVILFRHCLEILLSPREILEKVRERLAPGGLLMIYTSNLEYHNLMSPFTNFLYTRETLSRLLALTGFEVEQVIAPPSPHDHATAVAATPHYELIVFAKPGERRDVELPQVDVMKLIKTVELGTASTHWNKLSAADLMVLLQKKIKRRVFKK